jgi:hypothetical protein
MDFTVGSISVGISSSSLSVTSAPSNIKQDELQQVTKQTLSPQERTKIYQEYIFLTHDIHTTCKNPHDRGDGQRYQLLLPKKIQLRSELLDKLQVIYIAQVNMWKACDPTKSYEEFIRELNAAINQRAQVNLCTGSGELVLHNLISNYESVEIVQKIEYLLSVGADKNLKCKYECGDLDALGFAKDLLLHEPNDTTLLEIIRLLS